MLGLGLGVKETNHFSLGGQFGHSWNQCSTVQYSTVQYSTVQYNKVHRWIHKDSVL